MDNVNVMKLNADNVCVAVKSVKEGYSLQESEMFTEIFDISIVGKTYDAETGTFAFSQSALESNAREWRDIELSRTDAFMLLPDYPYKEALAVYRQALRDWPSTDAFPDTRPELGV